MSWMDTYRRIDYIESDGNQYINTGITPSNSSYLGLEFEINYTSLKSSGNYIYGAGEGTWLSYEYYKGNSFYWNTGKKTICGAHTLSTGTKYYYNIIYNNGSFSCSGDVNASYTYSGALGTTVLCFFSGMNGASRSAEKLYYLNIYQKSGVLARSFVPVRRISDSVLGLYDLVTGSFYTNQGTGSFTAGPDWSRVTVSTHTYEGWIADESIASYPKTDIITYNSSGSVTIENIYGTYENDTYLDPSQEFHITATPKDYYRFGHFEKYWESYSNTNITSNPYYFTPTADTTIITEFELKNSIHIQYNKSLGSVKYSYDPSTNQLTLTALPYGNAVFVWWQQQAEILGSDQTITITHSESNYYQYRALFNQFYSVELEYDDTMGTASYSFSTDTAGLVNLSASLNSTDAQFLGWYIGNTKVSNSLNTSYTVSDRKTTFEARFEKIYTVTATSAGNGEIDFSRDTADKNLITFSVVPDEHYHFSKYILNSTDEVTSTPYSIRITADIEASAYFEHDPRYYIDVQPSIKNASIYRTTSEVWPGESVTIFARPFPDYVFTQWSDNNTSNPRTIANIQNDIVLEAQYTRISDTNGVYQYRCYVKDQLYLTDPPKAFMIAENFSISEDKLTNATSQITVLNLNDNINNGDILVLYDPMGTTIYQGVITSIETETYEYTIVNEDFKKATINCSQMQSFFKGTWIYNIHASDYLETEIAYLVGEYAQGKLYGSTYTDPLVAQRLGGFTIESVGSTQANLPSDTDSDGTENYTEYDMEEWIYSLYQKYEIDFQFEVNFSGKNFLRIKVPTYESLKVGNNIYAITDMKPIEEIEETNKLVIFNQDKTYKTTYIATKTETLENPTSTANRFNITNTKIVYMNDEDNISDIVANNLPSTMYNHKLTFTLILKNFIYKFTDFHLAMPLEVWHNNDYYSTVLTGWAINKNTNENITQIELVCGLVRKKLTQLLTLKKV